MNYVIHVKTLKCNHKLIYYVHRMLRPKTLNIDLYNKQKIYNNNQRLTDFSITLSSSVDGHRNKF